MALSDGVDNSSLQLLLFVQFASLEDSSLKLGSLNPKPFMFILFPINLNIHEMFSPFDIVSCQLSTSQVCPSLQFSNFTLSFNDFPSVSCFNFQPFGTWHLQ